MGVSYMYMLNSGRFILATQSLNASAKNASPTVYANGIDSARSEVTRGNQIWLEK